MDDSNGEPISLTETPELELVPEPESTPAPVSVHMTEPVTELATEPVAELETEPSTESVTEPETEPATELEIEPVTEALSDLFDNPGSLDQQSFYDEGQAEQSQESLYGVISEETEEIVEPEPDLLDYDVPLTEPSLDYDAPEKLVKSPLSQNSQAGTGTVLVILRY